jgi:hypothetical protein
MKHSPEALRECRLKQNAFDRWILIQADDAALAWSGSRWVLVDEDGLPAGDAQISNLETREEAIAYAAQMGIAIRREP